MPREIVYDKEIDTLVKKNLNIFEYEYEDIPKSDWVDFKNKPNCTCRQKIIKALSSNPDKFNQIISKLSGKDTVVYFPKPLDEPMVKEFDTLIDMESFLKELKRKGTLFRSAAPSPNGKGGFILIVM